MDLDAVYRARFRDIDPARRQAMWREICAYLQRFVPRDAAGLDLGCDTGEFIANIAASERWAADMRDVRAALPPDVRFVQADGADLGQHLPAHHFDVVFLSNYLEHLASGEVVVEQLRVVRNLLKPGGAAMVLQPNIRLVGGAYWDFIDHRVALTDKSLAEAAAAVGLVPRTVITRFLPFTTTGRLPTHPWLVRAYLHFPPAWWLLGKQTLFIAERPAETSG
jgi:SAM-dependent methyltransferase